MTQSLDTVDTILPAGSFAQAVLLSGVVSSTSASSSSNPEPILLELVDSGNLSRNFTSSVKGCRVIGSAFGVLSKERVMIRLEQLTCIEQLTGEAVTLPVDGYVSGEDGENGMRGVVIDRSGDHMRMAFATGFLSSFSNFLSMSANPVTFSSQTGLASTTPLTGQEMLKQGVARGAGSALDKFTEFYIKRAESLDPVIVVKPGRVVDVIFSKSISLGKSLYRQRLSRRHDILRKKKIKSYE